MAEAVADKEQAEYNSVLDSGIQWQTIAERNQNLLDSVSKERDKLVKLNNTQCAELDRLKEAKDQGPPQQLPDLEAVREHILAGLKLGKQASGYKAALKALDRFIDELRTHHPGGRRLS